MRNKPLNQYKLTILQILPALNMGGVETGAIETAIFLKNQGHNPLIASAGGNMAKRLEQEHIMHITLPLASKNPLIMIKNIFSLISLIKKNNVDIVHARSRAPAWSGFFACKLARIPFITTFHGTYNFNNYVKKLYNSIMVRGCHVIAISDFICRHIQKNYTPFLKSSSHSAITTINRGINLERYAITKDLEERARDICQHWNLSADLPLILIPGRLTRWKGQLVVIKALALLKQQGYRFTAVFCGSAQGRHMFYLEMKNLITSYELDQYVIVDQTGPDMVAAYYTSTCVVHASIEPEGFGRVITEAQAMYKPIIASRLGAPADLITHGQTGFLHQANDYQDLANQLMTVFNLSAEQLKAITTAAYQIVTQKYTNTHMFNKTLEVYLAAKAQYLGYNHQRHNKKRN